jgi:hypothetical protein
MARKIESDVRALTRYKWSTTSIALSVVGAVVTFLAVIYFQGQGNFTPGSRADRLLGLMDFSVLSCSFAIAVVALFKEPSPRLGLIALGLCFLTFFFYVR